MMCIDEARKGGGHNNTRLTKPFRSAAEATRMLERVKANAIAAVRLKARPLWLAFCLLPQSLDRKDCSIDNRGEPGTDQRNRRVQEWLCS